MIKNYATNLKIADSRAEEVNEFVSFCLTLPAARGPRVHSAPNRNKYQRHKSAAVRTADRQTNLRQAVEGSYLRGIWTQMNSLQVATDVQQTS
jgi:hypothetical protein